MSKLYKKFRKTIKNRTIYEYIKKEIGECFMLKIIKDWILDTLKSLEHMWIWDPKDGE